LYKEYKYYDKAITELENAMKLAGVKVDDIENELSNLYFYMNDFPNAKANFESQITKRPNNPIPYNGLAIVLNHMK